MTATRNPRPRCRKCNAVMWTAHGSRRTCSPCLAQTVTGWRLQVKLTRAQWADVSSVCWDNKQRLGDWVSQLIVEAIERDKHAHRG